MCGFISLSGQERWLQDKVRGKATTVVLTLGLRPTRRARNAGLTGLRAGLGVSCRGAVQRQEDSKVSLTCVQGEAERGDDTRAGVEDHGQVPQELSLKEAAVEGKHQGGKDGITVQGEASGATAGGLELERRQAWMPR